jgi:hypothetical protein
MRHEIPSNIALTTLAISHAPAAPYAPGVPTIAAPGVPGIAIVPAAAGATPGIAAVATGCGADALDADCVSAVVGVPAD